MIRFAVFLIALVAGPLLSTKAEACPDPSLWGAETHALSGDDLFAARKFSVVAGGRFALQTQCSFIYRALRSDRGNGYFTTTPDFTIDAAKLDSVQLRISVHAPCDASLLINTATETWYFDDDDGPGTDAMIHLTHPSNGLIDLWVGTYGPSDGSCNAVVILETF